MQAHARIVRASMRTIDDESIDKHMCLFSQYYFSNNKQNNIIKIILNIFS